MKKAMTREGRSMMAKMKAAGKKWAADYLADDRWNDYLWESISYLKKHPEDAPKTKKEALRGARNILTDLTHDLPDGRDILHMKEVRPLIGTIGMADYYLSKEGVDYGDFMTAWRNAAHDVFMRKNTISWVADEILFQIREG